METEEGSVNEETAPAVEVSEEAIRALFMGDADTGPEWVDIPGQPGCRMAFQMMDQFALDTYMSQGQKLRFDGGNWSSGASGTVDIDVAAQNMNLAASTVVRWEFAVQKPARNSPGDFVTEILKAPANEKARRDAFRALWQGGLNGRGGIHPEFAAWILRQCRRVNGMDKATSGNS